MYTKGGGIAKHFYIQKARHFSEIKTICVAFLYTKSQTLYVTIFFMFFLRLADVYKKHDTLRYVTFLYTKSQTLFKKQDNLRYVFIYKKPDTLWHAIFNGIFEIGGGGGTFLCAKQNSLCVTFLYAKNVTQSVRRFYIKRNAKCNIFCI